MIEFIYLKLQEQIFEDNQQSDLLFSRGNT